MAYRCIYCHWRSVWRVSLGIGRFISYLASIMMKRGFFANLSLPERSKVNEEAVIPTLFAEIKSKDLPTDLIAAAKQCFERGEHRLALAYLLHHALSWAQQQHEVRLHRSMTERECKRAIDARCQIKDKQFLPAYFLRGSRLLGAIKPLISILSS